LGVADPADITLLQSAGAPAANTATPAQPAGQVPASGQADGHDEVAKAARRRAARRSPATPVFDAGQNMLGIVRAGVFKPVPPAARSGLR
jgi:hypothetical protein